MGVGLEGRPSQTALAAAAARAAHLVVDQEPLIFRDTAAMALLGDPGEEIVGYHRSSGDHIVLAGTPRAGHRAQPPHRAAPGRARRC